MQKISDVSRCASRSENSFLLVHSRSEGTWKKKIWEKEELRVKPDSCSQQKDPKTSTHGGLDLKNQQIVNSDIWEGWIITN